MIEYVLETFMGTFDKFYYTHHVRCFDISLMCQNWTGLLWLTLVKFEASCKMYTEFITCWTRAVIREKVREWLYITILFINVFLVLVIKWSSY